MDTSWWNVGRDVLVVVVALLLVFQTMRVKGMEKAMDEAARVLYDTAILVGERPGQQEVAEILMEQAQMARWLLGKPAFPLDGKGGNNKHAKPSNNSVPRGAGGHPRGAGAGSVERSG